MSVSHGPSFSNTHSSERPTRRRKTERPDRSSIINGPPLCIIVEGGNRWLKSSKSKSPQQPKPPLHLIRTKVTRLKNLNHPLSHCMISIFHLLTSTLIPWHQLIMRLSPRVSQMKLGKDSRSSQMMKREQLNLDTIPHCLIG